MLRDDLRAALDSVIFGAEYLQFVPDPWQAEILRAYDKRIILNCCRRTGKSTVAAILSLHRVLYYPHSLILLVSPS